MNHYGFNPFVKCEESPNAAVVYDLLKGEKYIVDKEISRAFYGKQYKPIEHIESILKTKFSREEVNNIVIEGKNAGLIVETKKPYFREEIKNYFEKSIKAGSAIFLLRKIWLQPTGICRLDCNLCTKYINCTCKRNEKEWGKNHIDNLFNNLNIYKDRLWEVNVIGGNILDYLHLDYLLQRTAGLEKCRVRIDVLFSEAILNAIYNFLKKLDNYPFVKSINMKVYIDDEKKKKIGERLAKLQELLDDTSGFDIKISVEFLIDKINENIILLLENNKNRFEYFDWSFLYAYNLENIDGLRTNNLDILTESVDFNEFYFRKYAHRCWGFSFALDSSGEIKPCLWSKRILSEWKNGKVKHYLSDFDDTYNLWLNSSLKNNEFCKECAFRFCCKHCQVIEEYDPGIFAKICGFKQ